jgi:AraC-like DNA-binding protein
MAKVDVTPELRYVSWHFNLDLFYGQDVFEDHPRCETLADPQLVAEAGELMERDEELRTFYRVNEIIFHLCGLWSPADGQDIRERLAKSRRYERVLDFVRNSDATATGEMLAGLMGMRRDVFSRNFTRDMGITPKSFIARTLVRKASAMLLAPGASVSGVARELNFSSEYYFSHFFKRHTGTPPSLFRKHNAGR